MTLLKSTSKGRGRQGIALKPRISLQKEPLPCRPCPYLCTSELFSAFASKGWTPGHCESRLDRGLEPKRETSKQSSFEPFHVPTDVFSLIEYGRLLRSLTENSFSCIRFVGFPLSERSRPFPVLSRSQTSQRPWPCKNGRGSASAWLRAALLRLAEYGRKPHRVFVGQKNYRWPRFIVICMKK